METLYNKNYISREPVRYLFDVYSIGFVFKFSKQISITPKLKYSLNNIIYKKKMNTINTTVDGLHKIVFGPLFLGEYKDTPTEATLSIVINNKSKKKIFEKQITLLKYSDFSIKPYFSNVVSNINFAVSACYGINGWTATVPTDKRTLQKFNDTCKEVKPLMIISSGDIIYSEPSQVVSSYGIQSMYDDLIKLIESESLWANHTWVCVNDDHELSPNDGMRNCNNIKLLTKKLDDNFPISEHINEKNDEFRATFFTIKDINFITLDTVSARTLNMSPTNSGDNFSTILGEKQLHYLKDTLSCIYTFSGANSLIFIVVGKSMFGSQNGNTFMNCLAERQQIFDIILSLKFKNVCFICGDSHYSDFTEYQLDAVNNIKVREIRNSSVTMFPRNPAVSDNPNRFPNSFSGGVNNFGMVNVNGLIKAYNVTYKNYTLNGEQFTYTWSMSS